MTDSCDSSTLDRLLLRPFFLLVNVAAPVSLRWQRYRAKCLQRQQEPMDLLTFVMWSDRQLYERGTRGALLGDRAQVRLFNSSSSLSDLHAALRILDLTSEQRLRPVWDQYFMELAALAAQRSNCMKRRVGCVLVRDRRVISTGYNGTPRNFRNCNEGGCESTAWLFCEPLNLHKGPILTLLGPRCNRGEGGGVGLSTCLCLHAEENALLEAGRDRIREGATLYCDTSVCTFH
jgi:dCMP deaminase